MVVTAAVVRGRDIAGTIAPRGAGLKHAHGGLGPRSRRRLTNRSGPGKIARVGVAAGGPSVLRARTQGPAVICPFCGANDDKVIDSRASDAGKVIRRRRECIACQKRFTTYERVEETGRLVVVKRDGTRVPFSRENVFKGVLSACGKRPISDEAKRRVVDEVEEELHREFEREVPSHEIGQRVCARLRALDEVAYIRFASEHYRLNTAGELISELEDLASRPKEARDQQKLFS